MYSLEDKKHVLEHVDKFGIQSAIHAFGIGKSSIYSWQKKLIHSRGDKRVLMNKSTKPRRVRTRVGNWDYRVERFIQEIRFKYIGLGHEKVWKLMVKRAELENWNCKLPSKQTVARMIQDLKQNHQIPNFKPNLSFYANTSEFRVKQRKNQKKSKKQRPRQKQCKAIGERIQIDSIVLILTGGIRRYIIQATDIYSRLTFTYAYKSLSSITARDFLVKMRRVFPFIKELSEVQNDNGAEFHKHFADYLKQEKIIQLWNYTKSPKMNAFIERMNRTAQEEFIYSHAYLLKDHIHQFNQELMHWLVWYNTERPHHSLDLMSPMEFVLSKDQFSKRWWDCTIS